MFFLFSFFRESIHFLNFRSVVTNGKKVHLVERDRLWDWVNILLSGTFLNYTKLYKILPLKFQLLKRSFSLRRRTKYFASITALIFNSPVCASSFSKLPERMGNEPEQIEFGFSGGRRSCRCPELLRKIYESQAPVGLLRMRWVCGVEVESESDYSFSARGLEMLHP